MRSTIGLPVFLGIASAQARKWNASHYEHHALLDEPEMAFQNISAAFNSSLTGNVIPGVYLVEFSDGHVGFSWPRSLLSR